MFSSMSPSRFNKDKKMREVTPYREEPAPASIIPLRPTTPHPDRQQPPSPPPSAVATDRPVTPAPPEWTSYDAPINFTWVIPDELCGMGWPKSRDQVIAFISPSKKRYWPSFLFKQGNRRIKLSSQLILTIGVFWSQNDHHFSSNKSKINKSEHLCI